MDVKKQTLRFPETIGKEIPHVMKITIYTRRFNTINEQVERNPNIFDLIGKGFDKIGAGEIYGDVANIVTAGLYNALDIAKNSEDTPIADIYLPIPENIVSQFAANWSAFEPSWLDFLMAGETKQAIQRFGLTELIPKLGSKVARLGSSKKGVVNADTGAVTAHSSTPIGLTQRGVGAVGKNYDALAGAASRQAGVALNPFTQLSYKSPSFRNFSFSWVLSPRNKKESNTLLDVVNTLNKYMLPSLMEDKNFFLYPEFCDIEFMSYGKVNKYLPKIQQCAITNIAAKYDNKFHQNDYAPTAVSLSINLVESVIYTQETYEENIS